MNRTEALMSLNRSLDNLDDDQVAHLAEVAADMAANEEFTEKELAEIERAREDFKAGRTFTIDEIRARSDAFLRNLSRREAAE